MSDRGHRINSVSPETANSRYPSPLSAKQARDARKLIASGRMNHEQAAEHFGCELAALVAATEPKRGKNARHGNAVLNVRPEDRDAFRDRCCREGEAIHAAFSRHLEEHAQLLAWANATGFTGFSHFSPELDMTKPAMH